MPAFNPGPFGQGGQSPYAPQQYGRYETFANASPMLQLMSSALQMFGGESAAGLSPFMVGLNNQPNLYNNLRYQAQQQQHQLALTRAYENDAIRGVSAVRGGYALAGQADQFTHQTEQGVRDAMRMFSGAAGFVDNPASLRLYDTLTGGRSELPMAHYIHATGQSYQRDLATGRPGMSGMSASVLAGDLQSRFFAGGPQGDFTRSGGLTSGQFGEMFQSLASSGRMPTAAADPKLDRWSQPDSARQMKDTLGSYARVLGTMKEIFVAEGQGNAPVQQLLDAADALTGGMQQISAKQAETRIRGVYQAAKNIGLGSQAVIAGMQANTGVAQGWGVSQQFVMPVTQYGMEFRAAAGQEGILATPSWGSMNMDQMQRAAEANQIGFVASEAGNNLGMFHRMIQRRFGNGAGGIDASQIRGNDLASRAARAAAAGDVSNPDVAAFINQNERDIITQTAGLTGMSAGNVAQQLTLRDRNEEQSNKYGLQGGAAAAIREEAMERLIKPGFIQEAGRQLEEMIGGGEGTGAVAESMGLAAAAALDKMSATTYRNEGARNASGGLALKENLIEQAKGTGPQAEAARRAIQAAESSPLGAAQAYANMFGDLYLSAQQSAQDNGTLADPITGKKDWFVNVLGRTDKGVAAKAEGERKANEMRGEAASEMMGAVDPQGFIARFMQQVHEQGRLPEGEKGDLVGALKKSLGVTMSPEVSDKLANLGKKMEKDAAEIDQEYARIAAMGSTPEAAKALEALESKVGGMKSTSEEFYDIISQDKDLKEKFEKAAGKAAAGEGTEGGTAGKVTFGPVTIILNGEPLIKDAASTVQQGSRGGGPVTA